MKFLKKVFSGMRSCNDVKRVNAERKQEAWKRVASSICAYLDYERDELDTKVSR